MGGDPPPRPARAGCAAGSPGTSLRPYLRAILVAVGELGYREVTAADVLERVEPAAAGLDRSFTGVEDCFAAAYDAGSDCLCERLLAAAATEPGWVPGLRGALISLFDFVTEQPAVARALLIEVHAAGGRASIRHKEVIERLSRALGARRETVSRHSFSPLTGVFIIGGIEWAVAGYLQEEQERPELLWRLLPDLMHFAVLPYRGEDAAWAAFDEAQAMVDARS